MVVIGLSKNLLFKSVLGHCAIARAVNNVSIGPRLFLVLIKYTIDSYCSFKHSADTISLFSVCCLQVSNIFLEQIHHVYKESTFEIINILSSTRPKSFHTWFPYAPFFQTIMSITGHLPEYNIFVYEWILANHSLVTDLLVTRRLVGSTDQACSSGFCFKIA